MAGEDRIVTLELDTTNYYLVCNQSKLNVTIENTGEGVCRSLCMAGMHSAYTLVSVCCQFLTQQISFLYTIHSLHCAY